MTVHTAIKKLTQSDLSYFKGHVKLSKQKGINLHASIFVDQYFSSLEQTITPIDIPLAIIGPNGRKPHIEKRAIRYAAKNWRLDGKNLGSPKDEQTRYDALTPGDYAILIFEGAEKPATVTMILISQVEDAQYHQLISKTFSFHGRDTMVDINQEDLRILLQDHSVFSLPSNPLGYLTPPDTEEDVLYGNRRTIFDPPSDTRLVSLTPEQFQRQMQSAQETGNRGEELFGSWLVLQGQSRESFEWVSQTSARASYDYEIEKPFWLPSVNKVYVDVKTTKNNFDRPFHMSFAEIRFAAFTPDYRIARIFNFDASVSELRILKGVSELAGQLLEKFKELPESVVVDSISVDPACLTVEIESIIEHLS